MCAAESVGVVEVAVAAAVGVVPAVEVAVAEANMVLSKVVKGGTPAPVGTESAGLGEGEMFPVVGTSPSLAVVSLWTIYIRGFDVTLTAWLIPSNYSLYLYTHCISTFSLTLIFGLSNDIFHPVSVLSVWRGDIYGVGVEEKKMGEGFCTQ